MLNNNKYNKIKLICDLSKLCWFIEKHAQANAQEDQNFVKLLDQLKKDIDKHIDDLNKLICQDNS